MTSFFPNPSSVFGKLRLNVYVDASFSSGGSRSRSGMAMYLVDTTDGSESGFTETDFNGRFGP